MTRLGDTGPKTLGHTVTNRYNGACLMVGPSVDKVPKGEQWGYTEIIVGMRPLFPDRDQIPNKQMASLKRGGRWRKSRPKRVGWY
jgi:hypothetical protein